MRVALLVTTVTMLGSELARLVAFLARLVGIVARLVASETDVCDGIFYVSVVLPLVSAVALQNFAKKNGFWTIIFKLLCIFACGNKNS